MPLVAFPCRPPSAPPIASQRPPVAAEVILFPRPTPDSLTLDDLSGLRNLMSRFGGVWLCSVQRDGNGDLYALIRPRDAPPGDNTEYLIRRSGPRLVLSDARLSAYGGTLGVFERADEVSAPFDGRKP